MANNYLQFSEVLVLDAKEERDWAVSRLSLLDRIEICEDPESHPDFPEYERMVERYELQGDESSLDFSWSFDSDLELWLYAEESGNVEHAAKFAQDYLKKFEPKSCFKITWSETCSRPLVGQFGGGAVFITANRIEWMSAYDWALNKKKEFQYG